MLYKLHKMSSPLIDDVIKEDGCHDEMVEENVD